jgi:hypothetical protein
MEDPWANAWGEPSKPATNALPPFATVTTGSHLPELGNYQEDDLGIPSWSTGTSVTWNESAGPALWSQPSDTWELPIGKDAASARCASLGSPISPILSPVSTPKPEEPPPLPSLPVEAVAQSRDPSPVYNSPRISPPGSPDGFGTFESATTGDTWKAGTSFPDVAADEWGSAWGPPDANKGQECDNVPDEWLAAKLQKEKKDSQVVSLSVSLLLIIF